MRLSTSRRGLLKSWLALLPIVIVLWYFPYIDFPIRLLTFLVGFMFLAGAVVWAGKFPALRWALIAAYLGTILFLFWPIHRPTDSAALRDAYCQSLTAYQGCPYVWGGEGYFGIDCSGLIRKGMEDALANRGITTLNSESLRQALSLYWHDTNAATIGDGYAGRTRPVTICQNLNVLDYSLLRPGDMAVTSGGDHILAYLGNKSWIAADPGFGKVTVFHIPEENDAYFFTGMRIVRWKMLDD